MKRKPCSIIMAIAGATTAFVLTAKADTSFTVTTTTADAFLATGAPGNPIGTDLTSFNYGGAGTLAIAPASSLKGRFDSIIKFNLTGAASQFNSTYGAGNWLITGFTLSLASNFGVQGAQPNNNIFNTINAGSFGIDWLVADNWTEGTGNPGSNTPGFPNASAVSFNSSATLYSGGSASLGTYIYTPPGNNIYLNYSLPLNASLVADALAGGDLSLYFYAADNQISYLFNARSFASNQPRFTITAAAVPEPNSALLAMASMGGWLLLRRGRNTHAV